jgi:Fe-S-cluster containining protein
LNNIDLIDYEALFNKAREQISEFCINSCKALCCKKGFLPISTIDEVKIVLNKKFNYVMKNKLLEEKNNKFFLHLEKIHCPSLQKNSKCNVYTSNLRPKICAEFPIFIYGKKIMIAEWCPAFQKGLFIDFIKEMKEKGFVFI